MKPYQERVIAEKKELDTKLVALDAFINGQHADTPDDEKVPHEEMLRLEAQLRHMVGYSSVLGLRIAAFTP